MIKINLATRKRSGGASDGATGFKPTFFIQGMGSATSIGKMYLNADELKELPIRRLIALVVFYFAASYAIGYLGDQEVTRLQAEVEQAKAEQEKLKSEFSKTKGYAELKKALEEDELAIRTKLKTIETLMNDRTTPPKILLSLSSSIPKEVWLTELKIKDLDVSIRGSSLGYSQVTDFMKSLSETVYFTDVNLKDTQQTKDEKGTEVAIFELSARRLVK